MINLKNGTENIWNGFRKSLRLDITKAKKEGIEIVEGSRKEVEYIYDLLKERQRIRSTKDFLLEIFDNFHPQNLKVFIAKKEDDCLSGIITTCYKNKVSFWIGSPKLLYNGISPNELVLWESIKWACENKFEFYEIVGADDLSLYPFKSKFNGELVTYLSLRWFSPMFRLIEAVNKSIKLR
jgi:lipid II:glycine glycyltransferase (peptidoglycan interpeptide bridge formation enzyme)